MKSNLLKFLVVASVILAPMIGYRVGTRRNRELELQSAFEAGRHFSEGWKACEETFQIKWVEGRGWVCGRFDKDIPPGFKPVISSSSAAGEYHQDPMY